MANDNVDSLASRFVYYGTGFEEIRDKIGENWKIDVSRGSILPSFLLSVNVNFNFSTKFQFFSQRNLFFIFSFHSHVFETYLAIRFYGVDDFV